MIQTVLLMVTTALSTTAATAQSKGAPRDEPVADFASSEDEPLLTSLEKSLQPLRDRFNEHKGKLRFVTLLSPT